MDAPDPASPHPPPTPPDARPVAPPIVDPDLAARHPDLEHQDVPCLNCGYNLRGLREDGRCPECGTPVERSLKGNLLTYFSLDYLGALHWGIAIIRAGLISYALLILLLILGAAVFGFSSGDSSLELFLNSIVELVPFGIAFALLVGWWLFGIPDPAIIGTDRGEKSRIALRVAVGLAATALVSRTLVDWTPFVPSTTTPGLMTTLKYVSVVTQAALFHFAMKYLQWLAPRLPSEQLFNQTGRMRWWMPVVILVIPSLGMLMAFVVYWNLLGMVRRELKLILAIRRHKTNSVSVEDVEAD